MTAVDTAGAVTDFAVVVCVCGHTRAGHKVGLAGGVVRYLACGQGKRGHCDEFEEVSDAPADVPALVDEAPPVVTAPAREPAVPAVDLAVAAAPERGPWQGHRCPECGRTYRHPYRNHGAPAACPGRLEPVTVGDAGLEAVA